MAEASDLTPEQWRERLGRKLLARRVEVDFWKRYYYGDHDLPAGPNQHREAFRRFQRLARTNLCVLCAESMVHRTQVIGFRDPQWTSLTEPDPVWQLWQRAKMDAKQAMIWRKKYALGSSYVVVGVDPRNAKKPRVTIEGPDTVIVETDPADASVRLAALRLWHDSVVNRWMVTLYLPGVNGGAGWRYRWRTSKTMKTANLAGGMSWRDDAWEPVGEPQRSLRLVPVVPFINGDDGEDGEPAFAPGIDVQNRLNLTLLNRLTSERYAAFRQTLLLNYEAEEDPVTGMPIAPWKPGVTQIGTIPPPEQPGDPAPQVVQLQQTDTSGMLRAVEADMRAFAAVTITPVYYLPGDMNNLGAETVAALDAGHNSKVKQANAGNAEGLEEVLQLMAEVAGFERDLSESELVFARPETFLPSQVGDMLVKAKDAGIPLTMAVEDAGWSPQRVTQLRGELAAQAAMAALDTPEPPRPAPVAAPTVDAVAVAGVDAGAQV